MFGRFLPKRYSFFDHFENHSAIITAATQELVELMTKQNNIQAHANCIQKLERDADLITHRCVEELHKTFITPLERNDIYRLISRLDDVIDYVEDTAARITIYKLHHMTQASKEMATILHESSLEVQQAIKGLRKLNEIPEMRQRFETIHRLENNADVILRSAVGKLFDEELDPLLIIKWKEIYETLESGIDCCEDIANIIDGVIIEQG